MRFTGGGAGSHIRDFRLVVGPSLVSTCGRLTSFRMCHSSCLLEPIGSALLFGCDKSHPWCHF